MTDEIRLARVRTIMTSAEFKKQLPDGLVHLKARRLQCGLSFRQIAKAVGCSEPTYRCWESLGYWPSAIWLPNLAEALHCSIEELYMAPEEK